MWSISLFLVLCSLTFFFVQRLFCATKGDVKKVGLVILSPFPDFPETGEGGAIMIVGQLKCGIQCVPMHARPNNHGGENELC